MDKELINRAWRILPAEFKRVVKAHYVGLNAAYKAYLSKDSLTNEECDRCNAMREKIVLYNMYSGHHNLTSDAEGEEMLTVPRKKVLYMYDFNEDILICDPTHNGAKLLKAKLQELFGSKCLPDEACNVASSDVASNVAGSKPKPAEPKFNYKVDDKVRVKGVNNYILCGKVGVIKKLPDKIEPFNYKIGFENDKYTYLSEEYLEPYTEPDTSHETSVCENHSDNTSQKEVNMNSNCNLLKDCDKQFDNILKDGFSKERRLNIAVQMVKAITQCPEIIERIASAEADSLLDDIVDDALHLTDRLISKCEKGGFK